MQLLNAQDRDVESAVKDRISSKTCVSLSEESVTSASPRKSSITPVWDDFRRDLFEQELVAEVSQKVHQRAVSWMITICWSKNFSQECLWTTLQLYYCYRAKCKLPKEDLELTLLTCLSLALKMSTIRLYSTKELAALSSRSISPADIVEREAVILELIDFNVIIPHQLEQLYSRESLEEEDCEKMMMLAELMMVKESSIFFSSELMSALVSLYRAKVGSVPREGWSADMIKVDSDLKHLFQLKECKIVLNKYSSRLEVQHIQVLFQ